jgi:hypothetical protein
MIIRRGQLRRGTKKSWELHKWDLVIKQLGFECSTEHTQNKYKLSTEVDTGTHVTDTPEVRSRDQLRADGLETGS